MGSGRSCHGLILDKGGEEERSQTDFQVVQKRVPNVLGAARRLTLRKTKVVRQSETLLLTLRSKNRWPSVIHKGSLKTVYVVLIRRGGLYSQLSDHPHCLAEERSNLVDFHRA